MKYASKATIACKNT